MIRQTYEEKQKNKELRHQIIDEIMEIETTKSLESIYLIANASKKEECTGHILTLDEAIGSLDIDVVGKLYKMFCEDDENTFVGKQMMELCKDEIECYIQHGGSISECTA
ncbi:MAG: hypothetical protein SOR93_04160 [Clostridiales Family XIII bacterium]|nr:hypothetical protein [Clostridiales Family XIII bacterium]